jgi:hypothetical protein
MKCCFSLLFKSAKIINIGITGFEIWNVKKGWNKCPLRDFSWWRQCDVAWINFLQIHPVSEGYLRKIPVSRTVKCNSTEYLTASKTVACKQVQNFRPLRSFDFQLRFKINLRKQEKSFQRSDQCIHSGTNSKIK